MSKKESVKVEISVSEMDRWATIERAMITAISAARKLGDYDTAAVLCAVKEKAAKKFDQC